MLVPNGTVQQIFNNDPGSENLPHPLFSVETFKPQDLRYVGQTVDITGSGNVFAMEDLAITGQSDRDYNDVIFQVRGATGSAVTLDQLLAAGVVSPQQDWRNTNLGQALINYAKPYNALNKPEIGETVPNNIVEALSKATVTPTEAQLPTKANSLTEANAQIQLLAEDWKNKAYDRFSDFYFEEQSTLNQLQKSLSYQ